MLNEVKENDLLLVKKSFYHSTYKPYDKIKKGSILLVIENNFGATYKDRFVFCLLGSKKIIFKNTGLIHINSNNLNVCFELIGKK